MVTINVRRVSAITAVISKLRKTLALPGIEDCLESADGCYEFRWRESVWVDLREAINAIDRAEGALRRGETKSAWTNATVASAMLTRRFLPG